VVETRIIILNPAKVRILPYSASLTLSLLRSHLLAGGDREEEEEEEDEEPSISVIPVMTSCYEEDDELAEYEDEDLLEEEQEGRVGGDALKEAKILTIRVEGQKVGGRKMYRYSYRIYQCFGSRSAWICITVDNLDPDPDPH